jgi:uncharacterized membrane protein
MKPLIVLLLTFIISIFVIKFTSDTYDYTLSGRIAMCAMLFFTTIGHFIYTKGMTMMLPEFIPFKTQIVYLTGFLEVILGIGLLIPSLKIYSAWLLILFFIIFMQANINAAIKRIDYQKGTFDGSGLNYLWFRIPLQIFFMAWIYLSSIKIY